MAVLFWYLLKSDQSSVHMYSSVHWTCHFLQGTRNTGPCLSGRPVYRAPVNGNYQIIQYIPSHRCSRPPCIRVSSFKGTVNKFFKALKQILLSERVLNIQVSCKIAPYLCRIVFRMYRIDISGNPTECLIKGVQATTAQILDRFSIFLTFSL